MLAIVLTSVVVIIAYGAAHVGFDARARLAGELSQVEGAYAVRELLRDALRNARAPEQPGQPGFTLERNTLSFVAGGGAGPLDPDYDWLLTLTAGPRGLEFVGVPLGHAPTARVTFHVPAVTRWNVRVLGVDASQWQGDWSEANVIPRAVSIELWNDSTRIGVPLRVVLWAGGPADTRDSLAGQ
jgi:hypothetical protein